jgi:arylamine N-acetyltransferase
MASVKTELPGALLFGFHICQLREVLTGESLIDRKSNKKKQQWYQRNKTEKAPNIFIYQRQQSYQRDISHFIQIKSSVTFQGKELRSVFHGRGAEEAEKQHRRRQISSFLRWVRGISMLLSLWQKNVFAVASVGWSRESKMEGKGTHY